MPEPDASRSNTISNRFVITEKYDPYISTQAPKKKLSDNNSIKSAIHACQQCLLSVQDYRNYRTSALKYY
jgi:hypothetical protein